MWPMNVPALFFRHLSVLLLLLVPPALAVAQKTLSELSLDKRVLLIQDRVELLVPDSMMADPGVASERDARMELHTPHGGLVLRVQDLRELGTDDLLRDWRMVLDPAKEGAYTLERLPRRRDLDRIRYQEAERGTGSDGIFLQGLLVRLPDDGLVRLDAFVDARARGHLSAFDSLVVRIFTSVVAGPGRMVREEHEERLALCEGTLVTVLLPPDHVVTTERRKDLQVHLVDRLMPLLSTSRPQVILSCGPAPTPLSRELDLGTGTRSSRPGTFLGQEVIWDHYRDPDGGLQLLEFMTGPAQDRIHVALLGTTDQDMEDLLRIASSIEAVSP